MSKRYPDFELWITERENTLNRTLAGAVWLEEKTGAGGHKFMSGTVKMNPGVVISWQVAQTCFITLKEPLSKKAKQALTEKGPPPDEPADPGGTIRTYRYPYASVRTRLP